MNVVQDARVEIQVQIGHDIEKLQTTEFVVRAPPGMSHDDLLEFAFALSDVVLVSKGQENKLLAKHANNTLGKTLITVGSPLYILPVPIPDVNQGSRPRNLPWLSSSLVDRKRGVEPFMASLAGAVRDAVCGPFERCQQAVLNRSMHVRSTSSPGLVTNVR